MRNILIIVHIFLIFFFNGCASRVRQTENHIFAILSPAEIEKYLTDNISVIKADIRCEFEQNGESNKLYGDLHFENDALRIKLYSALNYARIDILCDSCNLVAKINDKTETVVFDEFDKKKIPALIKLILTGKIQNELPDIEITANTDADIQFTIYEKKINAIFNKSLRALRRVFYDRVKVDYEKYAEINGRKIPVSIFIESAADYNKFNAKISFAKNKVRIE